MLNPLRQTQDPTTQTTTYSQNQNPIRPLQPQLKLTQQEEPKTKYLAFTKPNSTIPSTPNQNQPIQVNGKGKKEKQDEFGAFDEYNI